MDGLDAPYFCVLKRVRSRSLDLHPTLRMLPPRLNRGRYNALI